MNMHQHLTDRGLTPYIKHWSTGSLSNNPNQEHIIFPLFLPCGKFIGHQRYFWRREKSRDNGGRYMTSILEEYKQVACYGWDNCFGHGPLFICEGIWDALKLTGCWVDAIAVLSNKVHPQLKWLIRNTVGNRKIIFVKDNDKDLMIGGHNCNNRNISSNFYDLIVHPPKKYKDVAEMSHDDCMDFVSGVLENK